MGTGLDKGDLGQRGPRSFLHPQRLSNYTPVPCRGGRPHCVLTAPRLPLPRGAGSSLPVSLQRKPPPCCERPPHAAFLAATLPGIFARKAGGIPQSPLPTGSLGSHPNPIPEKA